MEYLKAIGIYTVYSCGGFLALMVVAKIFKIICLKSDKLFVKYYGKNAVYLEKIHSVDTWELACVLFGIIIFVYGFFYMT